ncbi:methylthioribulose 1-phosphate dehydratase [Pseudoalteromonas sp. NEC-BIFX-2020_015]|uniref:methylthioribulose 1-phosphate dehydratase n=1 Tax=Pseudoalteromonas sp. NEC-BIFX-2020_015 TaxID=2729544 RepID=UPI001461490C|nr:methylthioribulose 1-phosphate dehydratase [Pseudoalteromonas sp. NEC-BIFX-2020_015]NMR24596.1 methylthioribulose 1-phosphate dehydratase [Pseudoalteromonas sp. NEC-BIFX-2020_015]
MHNNTAISELIEAGKWISQRGWVPATGGNFSARTTTGFVVTASGFDKGQLGTHTFIQLDHNGDRSAGSAKPSAETELHLCMYKLIPSANFVLHTHSVAATVLSRVVKGHSLDLQGYEMQKSIAGNTSHLDTLSIPIFDNDQDIDRLSLLVSDHHLHTPIEYAVLIRGHGLYVVGRDIREVRRHLEGLEFLFSCELERLKLEGIPAEAKV